MMSDGLNSWLDFLGYGDVDSAQIWFLGIEERSQLNDEFISSITNNRFLTFPGCYGETTAVYVIISKMVTGLQGLEWQDAWRRYRDGRLFSPRSEAVQLNLYPLGKDNPQAWPEFYASTTGIETSTDFYRWIREKTRRFEIIRDAREEAGNPLTICFGLDFWEEFAACLKLPETFESVDNVFRVYLSERVIFTPFFRNSAMTNERIIRIIELINQSQLNPFPGISPYPIPKP